MIGTTDYTDYTDLNPSARGTYRPFGPLKASLTESNRQEMQQDLACHIIYWNSHAQRVSKPSTPRRGDLLVIKITNNCGMSSFICHLSSVVCRLPSLLCVPSRSFAAKKNDKSLFVFNLCNLCNLCNLWLKKEKNYDSI
jgi:hypothetical protein